MTRHLNIFTTREAYLLVAASMFMGLFVGLSLQGALDALEAGHAWENLVMLLSELVIVGPVIFILRKRAVPVFSVLPLKRVSGQSILMAIVLVAGVLGLITVFEILALPFFPVPDFLQQMEIEMSNASLVEVLILMMAALGVAPLVEESIFRGLLQQSLFYRYGSLIPALIIPSLVFTLFHVAYLFYFPALVELLLLAFILAWLTLKTGNILVSMLVHALFNLSSFLAIFSPDLEGVGSLADLGWPWIAVSTLLTLLGVGYFILLPRAEIDEVYLIPPAVEPGGPHA